MMVMTGCPGAPHLRLDRWWDAPGGILFARHHGEGAQRRLPGRTAETDRIIGVQRAIAEMEQHPLRNIDEQRFARARRHQVPVVNRQRQVDG
jgi:hypothetical protein